MLTVLQPPTQTNLVDVAEFLALNSGFAPLQASMAIKQKSALISAYCQRAFGKRQLRQTFRPFYTSYQTYDPLLPGILYLQPPPLVLNDPGPIISVDAVTIVNTSSGTSLSLQNNVDYEVDGGVIYRLSNDSRVVWTSRKIVVDFTTGYVLPGSNDIVTLPAVISDSCVQMASSMLFSLGRDPSLISERVDGVSQFNYSQTGGKASSRGVPDDIAEMLKPFIFSALPESP